MNKFYLVLALFFLAACSSQEVSDKKAVENEAETTFKDVTPASQYSRAVSMIEADQNLNDNQKKNLVKLIDDYSKKAQERKNLQSRYRAVLVNQMLSTDDKKNPKVDAAKEKLQELHQQNSKDLEKFIRDFKYEAGENARIHQPTMIEVIGV